LKLTQRRYKLQLPSVPNHKERSHEGSPHSSDVAARELWFACDDRWQFQELVEGFYAKLS
jgi:hypothetical protein